MSGPGESFFIIEKLNPPLYLRKDKKKGQIADKIMRALREKNLPFKVVDFKLLIKPETKDAPRQNLSNR